MLSQVPGLLIACALKKEERGLRKHLGTENRVLVTGLGVDRTLRSLEKEFDKNRPSCLLFSGMAGQLDPKVQLGEVLLPEEWRLESGTSFFVDERLARAINEAGFELSGTGLTVSRPVASRKKRIRLYEENGEMRGVVSDSGVGIPGDDLTRVFDEFYRTELAQKLVEHSTGLGLAIVSQIVQAYGGTVTTDSEVGVGSRFSISLPLAPSEAGLALQG